MERKLSEQICYLFIADIKRRFFLESFPRIIKCLGLLTEDQIWNPINNSSNSIGNLVLHLEGNLRQYILTGLANHADQRKRDEEFKITNRVPRSVLIQKLNILEQEVRHVFDDISAEDLIRQIRVQGFKETTTSILIHVTEHLSYHTGQIAMRTKEIMDQDLGFYADFDLNQTGTD